MIAFGKDSKFRRFNPVLGAFFELEENPYKGLDIVDDHIKEANYLIRFSISSDRSLSWYFKTLETAEQTLEWLDQLYGVKFIPNEILKQENKEND